MKKEYVKPTVTVFNVRCEGSVLLNMSDPETDEMSTRDGDYDEIL